MLHKTKDAPQATPERRGNKSKEKLAERVRRRPVLRLCTIAMLIAVGLMLAFVESRIPTFVPVPGVKIGLANVATLFALYALGIGDAAAVSLCRVLLSSLLFGSPLSFFYSLAGAAVSLVVMWGLAHLRRFSPIGVSAAGGVAHNLGQIGAAALVMRTGAVAVYLPPLLLSGTVAGLVIGIAAGLLLTRLCLFRF